MDDYQRWRRREFSERVKNKPPYRFFPNRTVFHTVAFTATSCIALLGLTSVLLMALEKAGRKNDQKVLYKERFVKTDFHRDRAAIYWGFFNRSSLEMQREELDLPNQSSSSVIIRDPEVHYPEPKGQVTM